MATHSPLAETQQPVLVAVDERIRQVLQALVVVAAGVGCGQRSPARADYVLYHRGPVEAGPAQAGGGGVQAPGPARVLLSRCAVFRWKRRALFLDDGSVGGVDLGRLYLGDQVAVADVEVQVHGLCLGGMGGMGGGASRGRA